MQKLTDEEGNVYLLGASENLFGDPQTEDKIREYLSLIKQSPIPTFQINDWCLDENSNVLVVGRDHIDPSKVVEIRSASGGLWLREPAIEGDDL